MTWLASSRSGPREVAAGQGTPSVDPDDRDFLRDRCAELNEQFQHLEFALPPGPIHGDAHTSNLLTDHGQVVLLDFEAAAIGPREWDLLPTAIAVRAVRPGRGAVPGVRGRVRVRCADLGGLPGAAGDPAS